MSSHNDSFVSSGNSPTYPGRIQPDFVVENHGSIFPLKPQSVPTISWIAEHIDQDKGYQPHFPAVIVEHRYVADIVAGIQNDGLDVQ
jgi:hypothetical protein